MIKPILIVATFLIPVQESSQGELQIRKGPGPNYDVIGMMPTDQAPLVTVDNCVRRNQNNSWSDWCRVDFNNVNGWVQVRRSKY